jgi:arginyl-tRNA synthetase
VDSRQTLHLKQVFRCAGMLGLLDRAVCTHVNNGTMNGKDGKPYKTREGGVMRLQDLIETVTAGAEAKVEASGMVLEGEARQKTARVIGVAALKVGDLMNHRTKDYVFDLDRFLMSEGKTGPYLLYTAVRANSVLAKAGGHPVGPFLPPSCDSERQLAIALMAVPEALLRAFSEKAPNILCDAMFDIAGAFNKFYNENKILIHPDPGQKSSWLAMLSLTARMLTLLLGLLAIEVPESM